MGPVTPDMRSCLVEVLVYHQQINDPPYTSVCLCGWRKLGASWAEHVVDVFEASWSARGGP